LWYNTPDIIAEDQVGGMKIMSRKAEQGQGPICYIVGAGERTGDILLPAGGDLVIAADGGYDWLRDMGVIPDLLIGDFDSLTHSPLGLNVVTLPKEKNDTDTMAAVRLGLEGGYRRFAIYGGTGGRVDHTLANLQILTWLARRDCENRLYAPNWMAAAVTDGTISFPASAAGTISVFCQGDLAEGVCLEGLKYKLSDAVLTFEFALGISNEFTGQPSRIKVGKGTLLVVWDRSL
jgi:thiamine pyrophosphokinase